MKLRFRTAFSLLLMIVGIAAICFATLSGNGAASSTFILLIFGLSSVVIGLSIIITKPRPDHDLLSDYWGPGPRNDKQAAIERREQGTLVSMTVPMSHERNNAPATDRVPAEPLEWWK